MITNFLRGFRRGDVSPEHPGMVFGGYRHRQEQWITPNEAERRKRVAENAKKRYYANPEKFKASRDKWVKKPGAVALKKAAYQWWLESEDGRAKRREVTRRYTKSLEGSFANNTRSRIWSALKAYIRTGRTKVAADLLSLIGCSIGEFKNHLESHFEKGMSWENAGEWNMDHILPLSFFDLTNVDQQRLAFNWRNTRVVWAKDNRSKSDFITHNGVKVRARDARNIIPFQQPAAA